MGAMLPRPTPPAAFLAKNRLLHAVIGKTMLELTKVQKGAQVREAINEATVAEYVERIESGVQFPPIIVFFDGNNYWIADGWHRLMAHERSGCLTISAEVKRGGERDALQYALSANSAHGLPRTNADKRNAVEIVLADPEWSKLSTREIADLCAVSHNLVAEIRRGLSPADKAAQNNQARQSGENQLATESAALGTSMPTDIPTGCNLSWSEEVETTKYTKAWRMAELHVMQELKSQGCTVEDHSESNHGYDLYATKGNRIYYVEVKLLSHPGAPFSLTTHETSVAHQFGERYTLALTLFKGDSIHIQFIEDPAKKLNFVHKCTKWVFECSRYKSDLKFFDGKVP